MTDNNKVNQLTLPLDVDSDPLPIQLLLLGAIRQCFWIYTGNPPTYEDALYRAIEIAPNIISINSELIRFYESAAVRLYKQRAKAQSRDSKKRMTPLILVDADIARYKKDLENAEEEEKDAIETEMSRLTRVRNRLNTEPWTENKVIERDADIPERYARILEKGQGFKLYNDKKQRALAVRVLHPDKAEGISGVDLVYEIYRQQGVNIEARIIAIQYKMIRKNNLYTSDSKNLLEQLNAMTCYYCNSGKCSIPEGYHSEKPYRMPHCCAFLRITDNIQTKDGWYLTDGSHIRACDVKRLMKPTTRGHQILYAKDIGENSISQEAFQEFFKNDMIGSRWISTQELNEWYEDAKIFQATDRIVTHVRELES